MADASSNVTPPTPARSRFRPSSGWFVLATVVLAISGIDFVTGLIWTPYVGKEEGLPIVIASLGSILAAFAIWLTVRMVNHGEKPSPRLCVCVVLVIALGALSVCIPYYQEQQIVHRIESWGGVVVPLPHPEWLRRLMGDDCMENVKVFDRVVGVGLNFPSIGDAEIAQLCALKNLTYLELDGTGVTDAGLIHLSKLTRLRHLHIHDTAVTNRGIQELTIALPRCVIEH